jgi:TRAP transporter TAXI family solute receptor
MKKYKAVLCIVLSLLIAFIAGCSGIEVIQEEAKFDDSPITVSMYQGTSEGLWYVMATGFTECINTSYPGSVVQIMPGGSSANAIRLHANEADFGMTHSSTVFEAYNGIGQFTEKSENIRAIASIYPSVAQFVVRDNVDFSSFDEFMENKTAVKINIGQIGSGSYYMFQRMVEFYGYTIEDLEGWGCSVSYGGFGDIVDMFSSGAIDACYVTTSAPNTELNQISTNNDIKLISFNTEALDYMCENYGYGRNFIYDGSYEFSSGDVDTCATYTMLGASAQLDDAIAYKMTKALAENIEYLKTVHGSIKNITTDTLVQGITIPLHPGAEKYYREAGIID